VKDMTNQIIPIAVLLVFLLVVNSIGGQQSMYHTLILILISVVLLKIDTIKGWLS
jgi:hypothetical protein